MLNGGLAVACACDPGIRAAFVSSLALPGPRIGQAWRLVPIGVQVFVRPPVLSSGRECHRATCDA